MWINDAVSTLLWDDTLGRVDDDGVRCVRFKLFHPGLFESDTAYLDVEVAVRELHHLLHGGFVGLGITSLGNHRLNPEAIAGNRFGEVAQRLDGDGKRAIQSFLLWGTGTEQHHYKNE